MKVILTVLALTMLTLNLFGQGRKRFIEAGIGVNGGLPIGDFNQDYNGGFGGSVRLALNFSQSSAITLQTGYLSFVSKNTKFSVLSHTTSFSPTPIGFVVIPITLGYRTTVDNGFFFEPQLGVNSLFEGGRNLLFAFTTGYRLPVGLEVSAKYEAISASAGSLSFVGLGAYYNLPISRK